MELDKFEDADIKNKTLLFSNFSQKKYPNHAFLVPNLGIFVFPQNFVIRQIWEYCIQIWHYCFHILAQKNLNEAFFDPNSSILVFREILQIDQFEGADLKYDNSFLEFLPKKNKLRDFLFQI